MGAARWKAAGVAGMAILALAFAGACGDDDSSEGGVQAYCDLVGELQQADAPSTDDLDEIVEVAPDEIKDAVETIADQLRAAESGDTTSFDEEALQDASERLEEFDENNC